MTKYRIKFTDKNGVNQEAYVSAGSYIEACRTARKTYQIREIDVVSVANHNAINHQNK